MQKYLKLEGKYILISLINEIRLFHHKDIYTIQLKVHEKDYEIGWYKDCCIQSTKDAEIWIEGFIQCICEKDDSIITIKDIENVLSYLEDDRPASHCYFDHTIDIHSMLIDWIIRHEERLGCHGVRKHIREIKAALIPPNFK